MISRNISRSMSRREAHVEFYYETLLLRYKEERERTKMLASRASTMMTVIGIILSLGATLFLDNRIIEVDSLNYTFYLSVLILFATEFALIFVANLYHYFSINSMAQDHIFPLDSRLKQLSRSKLTSLCMQTAELETLIRDLSKKNRFYYKGLTISDISFYTILCLGIFSFGTLSTNQIGYAMLGIWIAILFLPLFPIINLFYLIGVFSAMYKLCRWIYQKIRRCIAD